MKIIISNTLTDSELMEYAEQHIRYEYEMMLWSARILAFYNIKKDMGLIDWTVKNSLLNSFSIHSRNLIDFLFSQRRDQTDVLIENYIDDLAFLECRPQKSELL